MRISPQNNQSARLDLSRLRSAWRSNASATEISTPRMKLRMTRILPQMVTALFIRPSSIAIDLAQGVALGLSCVSSEQERPASWAIFVDTPPREVHSRHSRGVGIMPFHVIRNASVRRASYASSPLGIETGVLASASRLATGGADHFTSCAMGIFHCCWPQQAPSIGLVGYFNTART